MFLRSVGIFVAGGVAALALVAGPGRDALLLSTVALPSIALPTAALAADSPGDAACSNPAYLVVQIDKLDRAKSGAYGAALQKSRIVSRHGGSYMVAGNPAEVLEGEWPGDRSLLIERYPFLDMLRKFWYSAEYQEQIKPLRAGSGTYTVLAFDGFVMPAPAASPAAGPSKP